MRYIATGHSSHRFIDYSDDYVGGDETLQIILNLLAGLSDCPLLVEYIVILIDKMQEYSFIGDSDDDESEKDDLIADFWEVCDGELYNKTRELTHILPDFTFTNACWFVELLMDYFDDELALSEIWQKTIIDLHISVYGTVTLYTE